ncbi:cyclase family protein [Candidatus Woesearchaeota archaeon]|nr:cyclase family protein [Candidatus Woesearchaeota archaeon]
MKYHDLTLPFNSSIPPFPGDPATVIEHYATIEKEGWNELRITFNSHIGTHIDAPFHMIAKGKKLDQFPIETFIGECIVLTLDQPDLHLIKEGDIVLFYTGHIKKIGTKQFFEKNPIISLPLAQRLVERKVRIVGIDSYTTDNAPFYVHKFLFQKDILIVENLTKLETLVGKRGECIIAPLNISNADGAPCRVIVREIEEEKKMNKTNDVIGMGSLLMDLLIEIDDQKLIEMDLRKGEMHLVDHDKAKSILHKIEQQKVTIEQCPGGSVANTLRGIGLLGGNVICCGKVGNDKHGDYYIEQMRNHKVLRNFTKHNAVTGHAIAFITPDAQRTFSVHLGAAIELGKEDVIEEDIAKSKILQLEAYQLEGKTREVVLHAIQYAKKHGTLVSLDLADPGLIRRNKEFLMTLLKDKVDIIFANQQEAKEFTGKDDVHALTELARHCKTAIVKLGAEGSLIAHDGEIIMAPAFTAKPVDTTGAGDTYAAGFLYGYCHNWPLQKAAALGSLMAAKIVEQKGVRLDRIDVLNLKKQIEEMQIN